LTPDDYEQLVAAILRQEGWEATVTPSGGDHGLDVLAEKRGIRLGVQVKMYGGSRPINAATVMLTHGAAAFADCTRCMIATNGRVLADAAAVAAKLDVEIRVVPASAPLANDSPGRSRIDVERLTFGLIWSRHVEALTGQTLYRGNGRSNTILAVDGGGLLRRTSNGQRQRIDIEVFRWTIARLLRGETVLREEINAECIGRVSSGVILILSSLPMFELTNQAGKQGLTMRIDGT
jgi:hypothetical protein